METAGDAAPRGVVGEVSGSNGAELTVWAVLGSSELLGCMGR